MLESLRENAKKVLTNPRTLVILVVAAVFIVAAIYTYNQYVKPRLDVAYAPNKEFVSKDDSPASVADLYFFYTTWCPHCKTAAPVMAKLKEYLESQGGKVNGVTVNIISVDCEEDSATADRFKVEGYPTIKLMHGSKVIEYDAKPDLDTLQKFLSSSL